MAESPKVVGPGSGAGRVRAIDLAAEYADLGDELIAAAQRVLASGQFIGGPEVEAFEQEFASFCGVPHGVSVASGTDALRFALMAVGVGESTRQASCGSEGVAGAGQGSVDDVPDEVITSPLTFFATTEAICQAGARPVFADVDPDSLTLDPDRIVKVITSRTKAIVPIHLYGQTADMGPILDIARARGLSVIEDACQAHGAQYRGGGREEEGPRGRGPAASSQGSIAGSLGDAGCFSFYPTKNLGGCGEGGFVTTSSADLAERVRRLRNHGQSEKYVHSEEGYNGRLDALQAALLRVKLKRLAGWNARRRALAARYSERLKELGLAFGDAGAADAWEESAPAGDGGVADPRSKSAPRHPDDAAFLRLPVEMSWGAHVYHLYTVRLRTGRDEVASSARDRLRAALLEKGIETGVHYPIPLHLQPALAWMGLKEGSFPIAERAAREVLSLPLYPELSEAQLDRVCEALRQVLRRG